MATMPDRWPEDMGPWPILDSSSRRVSLRRLRNAFIANRSSSFEGGSGVGVASDSTMIGSFRTCLGVSLLYQGHQLGDPATDSTFNP